MAAPPTWQANFPHRHPHATPATRGLVGGAKRATAARQGVRKAGRPPTMRSAMPRAARMRRASKKAHPPGASTRGGDQLDGPTVVARLLTKAQARRAAEASKAAHSPSKRILTTRVQPSPMPLQDEPGPEAGNAAMRRSASTGMARRGAGGGRVRPASARPRQRRAIKGTNMVTYEQQFDTAQHSQQFVAYLKRIEGSLPADVRASLRRGEYQGRHLTRPSSASMLGRRGRSSITVPSSRRPGASVPFPKSLESGETKAVERRVYRRATSSGLRAANVRRRPRPASARARMPPGGAPVPHYRPVSQPRVRRDTRRKTTAGADSKPGAATDTGMAHTMFFAALNDKAKRAAAAAAVGTRGVVGNAPGRGSTSPTVTAATAAALPVRRSQRRQMAPATPASLLHGRQQVAGDGTSRKTADSDASVAGSGDDSLIGSDSGSSFSSTASGVSSTQSDVPQFGRHDSGHGGGWHSPSHENERKTYSRMHLGAPARRRGMRPSSAPLGGRRRDKVNTNVVVRVPDIWTLGEDSGGGTKRRGKRKGRGAGDGGRSGGGGAGIGTLGPWSGGAGGGVGSDGGGTPSARVLREKLGADSGGEAGERHVGVGGVIGRGMHHSPGRNKLAEAKVGAWGDGEEGSARESGGDGGGYEPNSVFADADIVPPAPPGYPVLPPTSALAHSGPRPRRVRRRRRRVRRSKGVGRRTVKRRHRRRGVGSKGSGSKQGSGRKRRTRGSSGAQSRRRRGARRRRASPTGIVVRGGDGAVAHPTTAMVRGPGFTGSNIVEPTVPSTPAEGKVDHSTTTASSRAASPGVHASGAAGVVAAAASRRPLELHGTPVTLASPSDSGSPSHAGLAARLQRTVYGARSPGRGQRVRPASAQARVPPSPSKQTSSSRMQAFISDDEGTDEEV